MKHKVLTKDEWLAKDFNGFKINPNQELPDKWSAGSRLTFEIICICGKTWKPKFSFLANRKLNTCVHNRKKSDILLKDEWVNKDFNGCKINPDQKLPDKWSTGIKERIEIICVCGKTWKPKFYDLVRGKSNTCGKCHPKIKKLKSIFKGWKKSLTKNEWLAKDFNGCKINPNQKLPDSWSEGSGLRMEFICSCGEIFNPVFRNITKGLSKTCGHSRYRHKLTSKTEWLKKDFNGCKINPDQKLPEKWRSGIRNSFEIICSCGNIWKPMFFDFVNGKSKTCGKCNCLDKNEWLAKDFDGSKINPYQELPDKWSYGSSIFLEMICSCGNKWKPQFCSVSNGASVHCGCGRFTHELIKKEEWLNKDFNGCKINPDQKLPDKWSAGTNKCFETICSCGKMFKPIFKSLFDGSCKSCGHTHYKYEILTKEEWISKDFNGCKINPNQKLPDKWSAGTNKCFEIICSCGSIWEPTFGSFTKGYAVSCGHNTGTSKAEQEIFDFIFNDLNIFCHNRYYIDGREFDIYIPSKKICIEYNGLRWHGDIAKDKQADYKKMLLCRKNELRYIGIFEDEWIYDNERVKNYLKTILGVRQQYKIRPQKLDIKYFDKMDDDISNFLKENHYAGKPTAITDIWAGFLNNKLIAVLAIGNPTRQNIKEKYELKRICLHPEYYCYGVWSYIIKNFVKPKFENNIITSFSDNRRDTGFLYDKLGFVKISEIKPDYFWCRGNRRFHKSALRKTNEEKLTDKTETELREAQGYFKIYDCGKTKWNLIV